MKTVIASAFAGALVFVLSGCQMSERGGGVDKTETFRIVAPAGRTALLQGESKVVELSLDRGGKFQRDVKLELRAPKGLAVDPTIGSVLASDRPEFRLTVSADKDAAIGDYEVYVRATPASGDPVSMEVKLKVVAQ